MNKAVDYSAFDEVAVQRVVAGVSAGCALTPADRGEIVRRMAELWYSDGQIAHRLDLYPRSVTRIRARLGIASKFTTGDSTLVHKVPTRRKWRPK